MALFGIPPRLALASDVVKNERIVVFDPTQLTVVQPSRRSDNRSDLKSRLQNFELELGFPLPATSDPYMSETCCSLRSRHASVHTGAQLRSHE